MTVNVSDSLQSGPFIPLIEVLTQRNIFSAYLFMISKEFNVWLNKCHLLMEDSVH
jgi:hypothetical protein